MLPGSPSVSASAVEQGCAGPSRTRVPSTSPCAINSAVYETGTALQVPAFHVLPGMPPRAGQRHSHDYRLDVVVRRDGLDTRGMVVDLHLPDRALRDAAPRIDGARVDGARVDGVMTVEVFARWAQARLTAALGRLPGASPAFRVRESPVASGGF